MAFAQGAGTRTVSAPHPPVSLRVADLGSFVMSPYKPQKKLKHRILQRFYNPHKTDHSSSSPNPSPVWSYSVPGISKYLTHKSDSLINAASVFSLSKKITEEQAAGSLHRFRCQTDVVKPGVQRFLPCRSEEHTSELQSR